MRQLFGFRPANFPRGGSLHLGYFLGANQLARHLARLFAWHYRIVRSRGLKRNRLKHHFHRQFVRSRLTNPRAVCPRRCAPYGTCEKTEKPHRGVATRRLRAVDAALLGGTRFLLCNCRHPQQFYRTKFLVGDCKVLVFNFSFEITAARLNLCDGPSLDLELDSF